MSTFKRLAVVAIVAFGMTVQTLAARQSQANPQVQGGGRGVPAVQSSPAQPEVARFVARISGTSRNGGTPAGSSGWYLRGAIGGSAVTGLSEQGFDGVGSSNWPVPDGSPFSLEETKNPRVYVWRVEVKVLSVQIDEVRFELTWGRYDRRKSISEPLAGGTSIATMTVGGHRTLDLVASPYPSSLLENVVIDLELERVTRMPVLDLDLWLVCEGPGQQVTRHIALKAENRQETLFSFDPIGFTIDGKIEPLQESRATMMELARSLGRTRPQPGEYGHYGEVTDRLARALQALGDAGKRPTPPTIDLLVEGSVDARLQPDGSVEVRLRAHDSMQCHGGGAGGGRLKNEWPIYVKRGETVEFEFPTYAVACGMPAGNALPSAARKGVEFRGGNIHVDAPEFWSDQKRSLRLRVTEAK